MKTITIRFEDAMHKKLKKQLVDDEVTFQNYIMNLVDKDMAKRDKKNS